MQWNIEWSEPCRCLLVFLSGLYTHDDGEKVNSAIVGHRSWQKGAPILIDERELDLGDIEVQDVRIMAGRIGRLNEQLGESKMAIVTDSALQFGVARQFQMMIQPHSTLKVNVFKAPNEAVEWLNQNSARMQK